jgi:hypothetical protein
MKRFMSREGDGAEEARLSAEQEDVSPLSISGQIGHFIKWKRAKRAPALLREAGYLLLGLVSLATVTGLFFLAGRALGPSGVHVFGLTCPVVPCK